MSRFHLCNPINPATGLPMTDDSIGGVDVGGSPWGTDIHSYHNPWSSSGWENNFHAPV
ncbi:hypothetical protein [Aromatoleum petrolei]|uniref:hypothetical protein n=1 Tax=Aromatoleum petrolei TaxID=76116 RepID=UPI001AEC6CE3|nr:hypothetical protein [Aromatoleum petrolei]